MAARTPLADDHLALLVDLQRSLGELARSVRAKRAGKARRRGRQAVYSPPPANELPGPKASELDIARAKRLWRQLR